MASTTTGFRADIEGLRALAIVAVVLFHAEWELFSGGFVGVDVFFVISGFLITRSLVNEHARTGKISLAEFWARRVRRLLPAAAVVILGTWALALWVRSPLAWSDIGTQGASALTYTSNLYYGVQAENYFGGDAAHSPFLHTWSLSIEEQFYLGWPFVVLAGLWLPKRNGRGPVWAATAVGLASLALCAWLTQRGTPWAFYSLPTRAWEFAVGGFCAWPWLQGLRLRAGVSGTLTALGALLILGPTFAFDGHTAFPWPGALAPTIGTALLITFVPGAPSWATAPFTLGPVRYVGRISYSWYLTHWPAMVLFAEVRDAWGWPATAGLIGASFALAAVLFVQVETRGLKSTRLKAPRVAYPVLVGSLMFAGACWFATETATDRALQTPRLKQLAEARAQRKLDLGPANTCFIDNKKKKKGAPPQCREHDRPVVVLTGDSHARHWANAVGHAADQLGLDLVVTTYGNCPQVPVPIAPRKLNVELEGCIEAREDREALFDELEPVAVVSCARDYRGDILERRTARRLPGKQSLEAWTKGLTELAQSLAEREAGLVWVLDLPGLGPDPIECLAAGGDGRSCGRTVESMKAQFGERWDRERAAIRSNGAAIVDPLPDICTADWCLAIRDDHVVYTDGGHLHPEFVLRATSAFVDALRAVVTEKSGVSSKDLEVPDLEPPAPH